MTIELKFEQGQQQQQQVMQLKNPLTDLSYFFNPFPAFKSPFIPLIPFT